MTPRIAIAGHAFLHKVHSPQSFISGVPVAKGMSVKIVPKRTAGPYFSEINRAFLPIKPSPARRAAVLWGKYPARPEVDWEAPTHI